MKHLFILLALAVALPAAAEQFPDGTEIPAWFHDASVVNINDLGKSYVVTDYGAVCDSTLLQTAVIQAVIDQAAANGGGVIVIPKGTFLSGALFFRQGTHLHVAEGGKLKGSDDISNFPILLTRMEGQTLKYFSALVNADGLEGFTISGCGTIDGNGLRYWKSFWLRREYNRQCTNMEELRPRLVYLSRCTDAQISGVTLQNSPFWTTHLYKCQRVKLLNLTIKSPASPLKAPRTHAIDIDVCRDILVKGCYMSVNDDAIALKGGKGPWADQDENNGSNENIIIEDCVYGFCHGALTCGSESIHNRNILLRRIRVDKAERLLWLKMRPDTPQRYEYITVEEITGNATNFIYIRPWTQFFDLKGREDVPMSYSDHITMRNINFECETFFNVEKKPDQYELTNFTFSNLNIHASTDASYDASQIENFTLQNIRITNK